MYAQLKENIVEIEKGIIELNLQADDASASKKKNLEIQIKNAEDSAKALKIARLNLKKFASAFEIGKNANS